MNKYEDVAKDVLEYLRGMNSFRHDFEGMSDDTRERIVAEMAEVIRIAVVDEYEKSYDGPALGLWKWWFKKDKYVVGCVYMDEPGDFWFVAPNWISPAKLARNLTPGTRVWNNHWDGRWEKIFGNRECDRDKKNA